MSLSQNPFLLQKYPDLPGSKPVESAVKKARKSGEKVRDNPDRVEAYLDRLERLVLDPKKEQKTKLFAGQSRPRALSLLREMLMKKYVRANEEKMAQGAARVEERAAREMGIQERYNEEAMQRRGEVAVVDLEKSLDSWIAYLSDANEPYPVWFRYYAFRNILDLSDYDKDKQEFTKRSQGTTRLFPDIDRGALAYIEDMIEASKDSAKLDRLRRAQQAAGAPEDQLITRDKAEGFAKLPFAKQYAEGISQAGEITSEMRQETRGEWVRYQQGTDPTALWASLQNKGTAWCTKGFATAENQLKLGDFYVYYTLDRQGKPAIPRIAIRMQGDAVGEVRGVADTQQNLEGNMVEIAQSKYRDMPGGEAYDKKAGDMKRLTAIEKKAKAGKELDKNDILFLYEIDSSIQGFGYQKDPRIKELRDQRNPKEDAPIVFECQPNQIAWKKEDVNEITKAYVGALFPGVFKILGHLEHIYTTFPEGKITRQMIEIGGQTKEQLETAIEKSGMKINDYARYMMKQMTTEKKPEQADLVRLTVGGLFGDQDVHTTDEIYKKAEEFGLELCPAEVGPQYRLQYTDQPMDEWVHIGMKQIADPDGDPRVFSVERYADGAWLHGNWAKPANKWHPRNQFVFRLRK